MSCFSFCRNKKRNTNENNNGNNNRYNGINVTNGMNGINTIVLYINENGEIDKLSTNEKRIIFNSLNKSMIEKLKILEYSINNLERQIVIKKKDFNNYLSDLNSKLTSKYECSICFDNAKEIVLVPCGHSFCERCFVNSDTCYICRTVTIHKQKIY